MADNQTPAYGIDDATLERAAEAFYDHLQTITLAITGPDAPRWNGKIGPSQQGKDNMVAALRAALTVLGPAIEHNTHRRLKAWICQRAVASPSDAYNEGYQDALNDLWEYLNPATEPDAESGAGQ